MLAVIEVDDLDEAIDVVNGRVRPVGRRLHAGHQRRAAGGGAIDTGIVYVNAPTIGAEIPLPFGGTKHTGNGFREAGHGASSSSAR